MEYRGPVAAMLMLMGCYAPPQSPLACLIRCTDGAENACPGDLICTNGYCGDGETGGDCDADTIADVDDNCPALANVDQHDEDRDDIGDVCDPCPHLHGDAVDGDNDGVGDACDPQPTVAKQRILFFDPFTSAKTEWEPTGGWSLITDSMRGQGADAYTRLRVPNGEVRIATGGTIPSVDSSTPHGLTVAFGINGPDFHYCEFYDASGTAGHIGILYADNDVYTSLTKTSYTGALPTGAWSMTIDESVADQSITVVSTLGGMSRPMLMAKTTALVASQSQFLEAKNADVRLEYYIVIETMP